MTPAPRSENHHIMSTIQPICRPQTTSIQVPGGSDISISFENPKSDPKKEEQQQQGIVGSNGDETKGPSDDASSASSTQTPPTGTSESSSSSLAAINPSKIVAVVTPQETTTNHQHSQNPGHKYEDAKDTTITTPSISTPTLSMHDALSATTNNSVLVAESELSSVSIGSGSSSTINPLVALQPSLLPSTSIAGMKRKISSTTPAVDGVSPASSQSTGSNGCTSMSRRDSLPMGLRNKKMKATDCLLFAATLLEQDAAEALVAVASPPVTTTSASIISVTTSSTTALLPTQPTKKKPKPMKKMLCEKVERSLQEAAAAAERQKEEEQQEESEEDGDDSENKPKEADVLCGRGGKVNKHPGNIVYRKVVEYNKSYYQSVHKKHRILVSQSIVKAILNYGGRFMGQKGKEWSPICFKRAVQKTSQALRERSNTSDVLQGVQPGVKQVVQVAVGEK